MKVTFSRNMNGDALVLVDDEVVALAKECEGYDYLKAHILAFATPPKDADVEAQCPKCGSADTENTHHADSFAHPECWVLHCNSCGHEGAPE